MSAHGAVPLHDFPLATLRVRCDICGRAGQYPHARLLARFGGDAGLPDVLRTLADCPRWGDAGTPCGAHFPDLAPG